MPGNGNGGNGGGGFVSTGEGGRQPAPSGEGRVIPLPSGPEPEEEPEPRMTEPLRPSQSADIDRSSRYATPDYAGAAQAANLQARSASPEMPVEAGDYTLPDAAFGTRLY